MIYSEAKTICGMPVPKTMCRGARRAEELCNRNCSRCPIQEAFELLSKYQATGLSPENILKMKKEKENAVTH